MDKNKILEVEHKIGYKFNDKTLLKQAFTHSSYTNEFPQNPSNEALEFLGDAILNFIVADNIYFATNNSKRDAGEMTKEMGSRVSRAPLAHAIRHMDLFKYMRLGKGASNETEQLNEKSVSNLFEAIVAGIYIDSNKNLDIVKNFVMDHLKITKIRDYKSELSVYCQKNKISLTYVCENDDTPFTVAVLLDNVEFGRGTGSKKQDAQKHAAKQALKQIRSNGKI